MKLIGLDGTFQFRRPDEGVIPETSWSGTEKELPKNVFNPQVSKASMNFREMVSNKRTAPWASFDAGSFNGLFAKASADYRTTHTFWILMCDVGKRIVPHIMRSVQ